MNITHVSPPRHVGARVGLRGSATWSCVPRRTHVGPAQKSTPFFIFFLIVFNRFKSKINSENSRKFPKN